MAHDTDKLQGKTIVITGITSGLGRGSAIRLTELGANVVGIARRTEALEDLNRQIKNTGGNIHTLTGDVGNLSDIEKLAAIAIEKYGGFDIWINNVGIGALGYFWDIPPQDHARLIDVNLKGLVFGAHVAMRHFFEKGKGILLNIGSIDSEVPLALQNTYAATKAGVLSLGRTLDEELKLSGNTGIKIGTIMPWAVDTPWWIHAANYTGHKPRMAAMDDPQRVVDEIVKACTDPKVEMPVGPKAGASYIFHKLFPNLTERASAKLSKKESEKAAPAAFTTGSIYEPMKEGTTVTGGIRERMEREDDAAN